MSKSELQAADDNVWLAPPAGSEIATRVLPGRQGGSSGILQNALVTQLCAALERGYRVCIDISACCSADGSLARLIVQLPEVFSKRWFTSGRLTLSVDAGHPDLATIADLRACAELGFPRLALRLGSAKPVAKARWNWLVHASFSDQRLTPVPAMPRRGLSGLHAAERGEAVMPASCFEVPANTAWTVMAVDIADVGSEYELRCTLAETLRRADSLIDTIDWYPSVRRLDALLNRRVAMHISGIGVRLRARYADPSDPQCFNELERWLKFVRNCFVRESRKLARCHGPFPELAAGELVATLTPYYGAANARRLVANRSLRHRHLLALSPFALLPRDAPATDLHAWLNLIPALSCADTLSMTGSEGRSRLTLNSWARLLQLLTGLAAGGPEGAVRHRIYC